MVGIYRNFGFYSLLAAETKTKETSEGRYCNNLSKRCDGCVEVVRSVQSQLIPFKEFLGVLSFATAEGWSDVPYCI